MYLEDRSPFFNVRKEKVRTEVSGILIDKVALINEETNDVLGLVSPGYEVVTNESVNDLFMNALEGTSVKEVHDHLDTTTKKWRRRFIFDDDSTNVEITKGDNVNILLEVFNGYDARTAFGFNLMAYRWICENGQVMGKENLFKESYAHYIDSPDKLRQSFTMKYDAYRSTTLQWKEWTQIAFNEKNFEDFISKRDYLGDRVKEAVISSYEPIMNQEKLNENKWGAFNVLTYMATHDTKARKGSNVFSARHKNINRAAADLYLYEGKEAV